MKSIKVFDPVCKRGWPLTITRNFSNPWRLFSILTSLNLLEFNSIFPGNGGITTLVLSSSKNFLRRTKSEYLLRTELFLLLNAGIFVLNHKLVFSNLHVKSIFSYTYSADNLIIGVLFSAIMCLWVSYLHEVNICFTASSPFTHTYFYL